MINESICGRCSASLERGCSSLYSGSGELIEVICFACRKREDLAKYQTCKVITSNLLMENYLELFYILESSREPNRISLQDEEKLSDLKDRIEIQLAQMALQKKTKEFEAKVWFGGLQKAVRASTTKGVSAKLGKEHNNFCVLTYSICGRTMFTIEDDADLFTCITAEDSQEICMGIQGIRSTKEDALALIDKAIKLWETGELKFKEDTKVGMF